MRNILKASFIVGTGSAANILLSVIRYKYIAVLLGPTGIGLVGILLAATIFAATMFCGGCDNGSIRLIGQKKAENKEALAKVIAAIHFAGKSLFIISFLFFLIFSHIIARLLLGNQAQYNWIIWLGLAVAFTVLSACQIGILNGFSQVRTIALTNVLGGIIGTIVAVITIYLSKKIGLIAMIVATPVTTCLVSWIQVKRLCNFQRLKLTGYKIKEYFEPLKDIFGLGLVFASSVLFASLVQFLSRIIILHKHSLAEVGYFQAAWSVSSVYLTFILTALSAEYYPRISAIASNESELNKAVNVQIHAVLLMSVPVILTLILICPLVIKILYAQSFLKSVKILKWQLVGDILKVVGWAASFLLLARSAKFKYLLSEIIASTVYLFGLVVILTYFGLDMIGVAYIFYSIVYLLLISYNTKSETRFQISIKNKIHIIVFFIIGVFVTFYVGSSQKILYLLLLVVVSIAIYCFSALVFHTKKDKLGIKAP